MTTFIDDLKNAALALKQALTRLQTSKVDVRSGEVYETALLATDPTGAGYLTNYAADFTKNIARWGTSTRNPFGIPGWAFSRTDTNCTATALDNVGNVVLFPARTNLIQRSQEFATSPWVSDSSGTGVAATVTANFASAPDGTTTAARIQLNKGAGVGFSRRQQGLTMAAGIYTGSVWMRTNDGSTTVVGLRIGAVGIAHTVTSSWQRFQVSTGGGATDASLQILLWDVLSTSQTADILAWGGQVELGSTVTAYIPTTTAPVGVGAPRITNRGILVEEARTNALTYSQDYSNAAWTKLNCTMLAGQSSPDGGTNAYKLQETTFNAAHLIFASMGAGTGATVMSVYLKAAERTWARISEDSAGGKLAYINLSTGAVGTVSAGLTVQSVVAAPNGWWRVNVLIAGKSAGGNIAIGAATGDGTESYAGTLNSGILIYQADLQAGSFATSPIITTGLAGTRGGDNVSVTNATITSLLSTPFTMFADFDGTPSSGAGTVLRFGLVGGPNIVDNDGGNNLRSSLAAVVYVDTGGIATTANLPYKAAFRVTSGSYGSSYNGGVAQSSSQSSGLVTTGDLFVGNNGAGNVLNNYVRRFRILPFAATDAQLQTMTT